MALTNGVVDWSLTVLILVVHKKPTLIAEELKERSLLKCVFFAGVHSQLDQNSEHLEGNLLVWNDAG